MNGKKTIKPFDLEAAKNGAQVETRSGKKVEIFKWDARSNFPLKGIYENNEGYECAGSWALNGEWGSDSSLDLVIVEYEDEKQRRQLRNGIRDLLQSGIRLMRMETENVIDEVQTLNNTKAQC